MDRYPPIAEHGLTGDLQTAALVSTDGTIDWFCCPRFDSPSVFASLLAESDECVVRQLYFPDTAIFYQLDHGADQDPPATQRGDHRKGGTVRHV